MEAFRLRSTSNLSSSSSPSLLYFFFSTYHKGIQLQYTPRLTSFTSPWLLTSCPLLLLLILLLHPPLLRPICQTKSSSLYQYPLIIHSLRNYARSSRSIRNFTVLTSSHYSMLHCIRNRPCDASCKPPSSSKLVDLVSSLTSWINVLLDLCVFWEACIIWKILLCVCNRHPAAKWQSLSAELPSSNAMGITGWWGHCLDSSIRPLFVWEQ